MTLGIDLLAVGDADAIILRHVSLNGREHVTVVDGGNPDDGARVVDHVRSYTSRGEVDLLISTHPDQDHIGGLFTVIENLPVKKALVHDPRRAFPDFAQTLERLRRRGQGKDDTRVQALEAGVEFIGELERRDISWAEPFSDSLVLLLYLPPHLRICGPSRRFYESTLQQLEPTTSQLSSELARALAALSSSQRGQLGIPSKLGVESASSSASDLLKLLAASSLSLSPTLDQKHDESCINQTSVVLSATVGSVRHLFTADANEEAMQDAMARDSARFADVDWFQVPHHGSKRNLSNDLVRQIQPKVAAISAEGNLKHPSRAVVNAFDKIGATVYSTHTGPGSLWFPPLGASRGGYVPASPLNG